MTFEPLQMPGSEDVPPWLDEDEEEVVDWIPPTVETITHDVRNGAGVLSSDVTPNAPPPGRLSIRWVRDALEEPPPEPPPLVKGLIREGELAVVGAPRAIGKSWLGMNLATLLSYGKGAFLGELDVVAQARTLIAQGEVDEYGSYSRWCMLTEDSGRPDGVAESFDRWRIRVVRRRTTAHGDTHEWSEALIDPRLEEAIATHGFKVLVIDPWAVYFAGNENSNDETEAALDTLRDLAMRYGIAIVILHHLSKALDVREPEDAWRGASRLADWASTRVTLLPHYSATAAKKQGMSRQQARRYADVRFLRRAEPTDDFSVYWNPTTGWWERWVAPEEVAEDRRAVLQPADIAESCRLAGGWDSIMTASEYLDVSRETLRPMLARAVREGHLEDYQNGRSKGFRVPGEAPKLTDQEAE